MYSNVSGVAATVTSVTGVAGTPGRVAQKDLAGPDLTAPRGEKRTGTG